VNTSPAELPTYPLGCGTIGTVGELNSYLIQCRACPRLVAYRESIPEAPPRQFLDNDYWARPVPGFGDPHARILIAGLAPSANGSNRTGRMFTGDKSGDFLVAALYRAGFANQPSSVSNDDGLRLTGIYLTAPVHCAPPANKPTAAELETCRPYLARELALLQPAVIIALGSLGWDAILRTLGGESGREPRAARPKFGHGAEASLDRSIAPADPLRPPIDTADSIVPGPIILLGCYHPSPQNTNTGKLTAPMLDQILHRARMLATADGSGANVSTNV